jgi:hypothetical protein
VTSRTPPAPSTQLLGLLLPKYVPDTSRLFQASWEGVLDNTDALVHMLRQHVIEPLLEGVCLHGCVACVCVCCMCAGVFVQRGPGWCDLTRQRLAGNTTLTAVGGLPAPCRP